MIKLLQDLGERVIGGTHDTLASLGTANALNLAFYESIVRPFKCAIETLDD